MSKLVQVSKFQLFISIICEAYLLLYPFLVPGDCDVTNGVKFWNFWYLGFITEFLVSKLVQVSNFKFLLQLFGKLFAFDTFLVPGDCDVTNGVKFWNFWNFDFITAFLVWKLIQMPNFNFLFQLFVKLFPFDPFFVPGDFDVINGVKFLKFLIVGLHHWISRVKISASVPISTVYFNYLWSYLLLTLFWSLGIATSLTGSNFEFFDIWASSLNFSCQN